MRTGGRGRSPPRLAAHVRHLLDEVQVQPQALALRAHHATGTQRAVHVLEKRLRSGSWHQRSAKQQTHARGAPRALVNSTDAGPTGSDESTMMASYEPGSAS